MDIKEKERYDAQLGFLLPSELKALIEEYSRNNGLKPAIVIRQALVKFFEEKGLLKNPKEDYL